LFSIAVFNFILVWYDCSSFRVEEREVAVKKEDLRNHRLCSSK